VEEGGAGEWADGESTTASGVVDDVDSGADADGEECGAGGIGSGEMKPPARWEEIERDARWGGN
jgi:hypothetical protein